MKEETINKFRCFLQELEQFTASLCNEHESISTGAEHLGRTARELDAELANERESQEH